MQTASTGAKKARNPQRGSLAPPNALLELFAHYDKGSVKYGDHNWRGGMPWSWNYDALMRHLLAFWNGEDIDAETGSKHITAVAWHAIALSTYMDEHPELDDRLSTIKSKEVHEPVPVSQEAVLSNPGSRPCGCA